MINVTKIYIPNEEKYLSYVDKIYKNGWITNNISSVQELEKRFNKINTRINIERN